jgi:hypothetical protein
MSVKTCNNCGKGGLTEEFRKGRNQCLVCHAEYLKEYRAHHKDELKQKRKIYVESNPNKTKEIAKKSRQKHKEQRALDTKNYYIAHQEELVVYARAYYQDNKEECAKEARARYKKNRAACIKQKIEYQRNRYRSDPFYRLRSLVSRAVGRMLKLNGSSKRGGSVMNHLSFSIVELKEHLEKQFEPWMTWNNYGQYSLKTWNDNDPTTWTWQLDHIVPQNDLPYTSMVDENFYKCWALCNLRPLSSKRNLLDGNRRTKINSK